MGICADYRADDRMLWMSDMGWVVEPILIYATTLICATMVMAEGAHDYPDEGRFWRLIQDHRVSMLGIAPTIIRSFMQTGGSGVERHDLSSLRIALATGEAWTPEPWNWMFEKVCHRRVPIINYSGGTEVGGTDTVHISGGVNVPALLDDVNDLLQRSDELGLSREQEQQLPNRTGCSIAEVDHHDAWQRAQLTLACVAREAAEARRLLDDAERWLNGQAFELGPSERELVRLEDGWGS